MQDDNKGWILRPDLKSSNEDKKNKEVDCFQTIGPSSVSCKNQFVKTPTALVLSSLLSFSTSPLSPPCMASCVCMREK